MKTQKYTKNNIQHCAFANRGGLRRLAYVMTIGCMLSMQMYAADIESNRVYDGVTRLGVSGSGTATNVVFQNANASSYGGAINYSHGDWTVISGTFQNNSATNYGGAIALRVSNSDYTSGYRAAFTGVNILFLSNTVTGGDSSGAGGAIGFRDQGGLLVLVSSTFQYNYSDSHGGAIAARTNATADNSRIELTDVAFMENKANNSNGGGIYAGRQTIMKDVSFESNTATNGGAIYYLMRSADSFVHSASSVAFKENKATGSGGAIYGENANFSGADLVFEGNEATGDGGALWLATGNYNLKDVYFVNNSGSNGGAIRFNSNGAYSIDSGTFTGNYAASTGGAISINTNNFTGTNLVFTSNTSVGSGGAINAERDFALAYDHDVEMTGNVSEAGTGGFLNLSNSRTFTIDIAEGATVTIGSVAGGTAVDSISSGNSSMLLKGQGGMLVLNADNSLFTGTTAINEGSLLLGNANAKLGGAVTTATNAIFGGLGTANNISIDDGGILQIGLSHNNTLESAGSIFNVDGTLNLADGSILRYDLFDNNISDALNVGGLSVAASSTGIIDVNIAKSGTYTIMNNTGGVFAASDTAAFTVTENGATLSSRVSTLFDLDATGASLLLTIGKTSHALTWDVASGLWDGDTANWDGNDDKFLSGDRVTFAGAGGDISVAAAGVFAADMTVDTTGVYTFTGGAITTDITSVGDVATFTTPTGKLTKDGAGTLILDNEANNFTAGIALNSGTLQGNAATLGSAVITATAGADLVFSQTAAGAYTGTINGAANITKTGAAALALTYADQLINAAATKIAAGALATGGFDQTLKNLSGAGDIDSGAVASTLTLDSSVEGTFSGTISGAASVIKTGAATLILAGDNTYEGATTINSGTLQLGDGATAAGGVAGAITNNAALVANHGAFSSTLAATLGGAGAFTKLGAGALSLTADSSAYAGTTQITAGSLLLDGSSAKLGGAIAVNAYAALGGSGTATGNVSVAADGAIIAGLTHNAIDGDLGALGIAGTLTLADKAILKYDLGSNNQSDLVLVGAISLTGTGIIDVNSVGSGTYTLITSVADLTSMNLANLRTMQNGGELSFRTADSYSLSDDSKSLLLTIETANLAITWAGTTSNIWTALVDNWSGDDQQFVGSDKVTFGTATSGAIVVDSTGVQVSDMIVNSDGDYTFTGGAIISTTLATGLSGVTGKLAKSGAGTLVLANEGASFVGGIDIIAGAVQGNTATLNVGATGTITNNGALVFAQDDDATYSSAIVGTGSFAKTGTGALTLDNAANTYSGGINVAGGALALENSGTATRGAVNIGADAALSINGGAAYDVAHALTGSGTLAIELDNSSSLVSLDATAGSAFQGTLALGKSAFTLSGTALSDAGLVLGANNVTTVATGTHTLNSLTIDGGKMIFSATAPADSVSESHIIVTDLDISNAGMVQVGIPSDIPAVLPDTSRGLLEQDDIVDGIQLIAATGAVTGDGANIQLWDQNGDIVDQTQSRTVAITKSEIDGTKVADAVYEYKLGTNDARDGLYLGYALAKLTIADQQMLEIASASGASEAASTLSAIVEGSGGLVLNAAAGHNATIVLGGNNTYDGETRVIGGTVKAGADNAFGNTSALDIAAAAAVDLNGRTQSIGTLSNSGALALGTGTLTVRSGGSSTGAITGAAGGRLRFETGAVTIAGANGDLHAAIQLGVNAAVSMADARGLGDGSITFDAGSSLAITNGGTLANTLVSITDYNGVIVKSGTGMLQVTANSTGFKGRVEVEDGGIELVGNASLGSATLDLTRAANARIVYNAVTSGNLGANITGRGTLVLTNGARMTMDRPLDAFNVELRNSTIDIAHIANDDETFNQFHVGGLIGTGTIRFNVNFGRAKHDQLIIDSTAGSGAGDHFFIEVESISSRRADAGTIIPLIVGADPSAQFELVGDEITPDRISTFKLYQGALNMNITDPGTWYLAASDQLTKAADAIINSTAMIGADWHYELESLNKRMGEVRRGVFAGGAPSGGNVWFAGHAYHINAKAGLGGYEFEQDVYGATIGADKLFRVGRNAMLLGAFAGMTNIDRDFTEYGEGGSDVVNGGVYFTWMHQGGFYADATFKYDSYSNDFTTRANESQTVRGDYDTKAFGVSLELGYFIQAGGGWWCEPSVQVGYAKIKGTDYTTDSDLRVDIDDATARQYRAMVRWGKTFGANLNVYVKAAVVKSTSSDGDVIIEQRLTDRADYDGVRTEFGIGTAYALGKRGQLWLDYEYAKADNYTKPWSFNAGYRWMW